MPASLVVSQEIKMLTGNVIPSPFVVDVHLRFFLNCLKITKA